MIKIILATLSLGIVAWAVTLFNWPDSSIIIYPLGVAIGFLYTFDGYFPVSTFMAIGGFIILIETALFTYRVIAQIISFVTGHPAPSDKGITYEPIRDSYKKYNQSDFHDY